MSEPEIEAQVSTAAAADEKARRSGRPAMNAKPTVVRLSEMTRARIDAIAGPNRMAVFIREAVENELDRREAGNGSSES